jgi:chromosome segregation ATPase
MNYNHYFNSPDIRQQINDKEREIRLLDLDIQSAHEELHKLQIQVNDMESLSNLQSSRYALNQSINSIASFMEQDDFMVDHVAEQLEEEIALLDKGLSHLKMLCKTSIDNKKKLQSTISELNESKSKVAQTFEMEKKKNHLESSLSMSVRDISQMQQELDNMNDNLKNVQGYVGNIDDEITRFSSTISNTVSRNDHIRKAIAKKEKEISSLPKIDLSQIEKLLEEKNKAYGAVLEEAEILERRRKETQDQFEEILTYIQKKQSELDLFEQRRREHLEILEESKNLNEALHEDIIEKREERSRNSTNRLQESYTVSNQAEVLKKKTDSIKEEMAHKLEDFRRKKSRLNEEISALEDKRMQVLSQLVALNDQNNLDTFAPKKNNDVRQRTNSDSEIQELRQVSFQLDSDIKAARYLMEKNQSLSRKAQLSKTFQELSVQIESYNIRIAKVQKENDELSKSLTSSVDNHSSILSEVSDQLSHFEQSFNIVPEYDQTVKDRLVTVRRFLENRIALDNFKAGNRVIFKKTPQYGGRYTIMGNSKYFLANDGPEIHKDKPFFIATIIFMESLRAEPENNYNLVVGTEYYSVLVQT